MFRRSGRRDMKREGIKGYAHVSPQHITGTCRKTNMGATIMENVDGGDDLAILRSCVFQAKRIQRNERGLFFFLHQMRLEFCINLVKALGWHVHSITFAESTLRAICFFIVRRSTVGRPVRSLPCWLADQPWKGSDIQFLCTRFYVMATNPTMYNSSCWSIVT